MTLSSALLSNLAILTCWGISQAAIASPVPETLSPQTFQVSQWSEQSGAGGLAQPQWQQEEGKETVPQWSEPRKIDGLNSPQWSEKGEGEPSPPARWLIGAEVDFLPHTLPTPAGPQPWRELLAEEVAPKAGETPLAETSETEMPSSEPSEEQPADTSPAEAPDSIETRPPEGTGVATELLQSPLTYISGGQPTALQLQQGEVTFNFYNRLFFVSNSGLDPGGTAAYPNIGLTWGITDHLELTVEYQQADSGSPGRQGNFTVQRKSDSVNADGTLQIKQKLWESPSQEQFLSGVLSLSWGDRGWVYRRDGIGSPIFKTNSDPVSALQVPFTALVDNRWQFTISPTLAFFPNNSAAYLHVLPTDNPGSFGTTFGLAGSVAYQLSPRLIAWGDAFVPLTGNNSLDRDSGRPAQTVAFNAGLRYLVNPRVAAEVFASNTLGSKGPLALTADRESVAFGTGFVFMPDFIQANRRYPDSFDSQFEGATTPLNLYGLSWLERETLNSGQFLFDFKGGSQGIFTAFSYGFVKDLEAGIYLDYVFGTVDESEQGLSGKIRLLNQAEGDPLTVSIAGTLGQTNQPFVNFFNDNRDEFNRRQLDKTLPFVASRDNSDTGQLWVVTVSLPISYHFESGANLWLTPLWGYIQRGGTELAGFNVGGSLPIFSDFKLVGEIGANFANPGNGFLGSNREQIIPWTVAVQWLPSNFLGLTSANSRPKFELYVTNRVGFSPWLYMRVQEQDRTAVGAGVSIPF